MNVLEPVVNIPFYVFLHSLVWQTFHPTSQDDKKICLPMIDA